MRSLRFIFIALITSLFVTNVVFLRRTLSVLLCGVLSFNSASCYSFLNKDEIVNAVVPPSTTVLASDDSSSSQKDEQKIAGFFDLPKIPISIPGLPSGNPLDIAKSAVIKEIGEAVGVGSPLLLDQKTAYPDVSDQVKDFHPMQLTVTSAEDLQKPLFPGDYSLSVIAYCTQFSIHAPGRGLPYKLAPLTGKQAPAISALLSRGTLQGIAPATLNADSWRIQAGLPLKQWPSQDQALIHKLIPEYEKGLEGDYLQQIENTYNQFRLVPGIPSLNDLLTQSGAPGQTVLQLRQARQTLANQTISAERLPDMLYEPTGDGLPRVLPPAKDSSPSHWAEVKPGVFARFTVIEGNLGKNLFEFRVTPKAIAATNHSTTVATKQLDKILKADSTDQAFVPVLLGSLVGLIAYSISSPAQALISEPVVTDAKAPTLHTYNIFIGGACDSYPWVGPLRCPTLSHIVENYEPKPPNSKYYSWQDKSKIIADIKQQQNNPQVKKINIIAHSYGADTAVDAINSSGGKINLLITIDPVGGKSDLDVPNSSSRRNKPIINWKQRVLAKIKAAKPNITNWIDIDPQPYDNDLDFTDTIANTGGKWDSLPQNFVNTFIPIKGYHHGQFNDMMNRLNSTLQNNQ